MPDLADQRGSGLLSTWVGALLFLTLLLFAVQLTLNLSTTSAVTAAGWDAARHVASRRVDHADPAAVARAQAEAEATFRSVAGGIADRAELTWEFRDGSVRLRVAVPAPRVLPTLFARPIGLDEVQRTYVVRVERTP